ncbi:MAG: hypothetical protein AAB436_01565 [Patescibacteria group bacterium]
MGEPTRELELFDPDLGYYSAGDIQILPEQDADVICIFTGMKLGSDTLDRGMLRERCMAEVRDLIEQKQLLGNDPGKAAELSGAMNEAVAEYYHNS